MASTPEENLKRFTFERILNQGTLFPLLSIETTYNHLDTRSKSINLLGHISRSAAVLIAEKTCFDAKDLSPLLSSLQISLLDKNDIYHWFLVSSLPSNDASIFAFTTGAKVTLIYPATPQHIAKYSQQSLRMIVETPSIYEKHIKPYIAAKRGEGRLNWVYNILTHAAETDRIIVEDPDPAEGFILLPDLKWDRKTMSAMYTMAIVHRRDVASLRDLTKQDAAWLRRVQQKIVEGIYEKYPGEVEEDQIKCYVHYQPSYYHFHIHAVHVAHDGGEGQAVGRALLLGNVISQLEVMEEGKGFKDLELTYFLGEESELWQGVFGKTKSRAMRP